MLPTDPRVVALRAAPPLAVLAALAALVDLAVNRVAVRAAHGLVEEWVVRDWMRIGALPRNLAGIAGIFALVSALSAYLRMPAFAPLYLRLPVAGFAGILLPTFTLALALPRERLTPIVVLVGMFATSALISLFAASAVGYRDRFLKVGLALAVLTAIQALIVITIASLRAVVGGGIGGPIAWFARHGGELTWLLVPLAVAPTALPRSRAPRELVAWAAGAAMLALVVAAGLWGQAHLPPNYATVIYGAFRVAALEERQTIVYVLVAALALGAAAAGMASPDPWRRQVGAGIALWLAGGYSARSPIQLLDAVLAIVLLARAAQAADSEGLRRAAKRWLEPRSPSDAAQAVIEREEPPAPR